MISIAEASNQTNASTLYPDYKNSKILAKKPRKKIRLAKTYRYSDEEILNSRLKNTRVRLNVGGEIHEVMWRTLKRMPFTRLGLLRKALSHDQIVELCDDYDLEKNEYYFDRHPKSFLCVLTMFRTGNLHMIEDLCIINFSEDLEYWGINENLMESCCHHRYHMKRERINEEMKKIRDINEESNNTEQFGEGKFNHFKKKLWDLMENPQTSMAAKVMSIVSVLFILASICGLTISTLPQFRTEDSDDNSTPNSNSSSANTTEQGFDFLRYANEHPIELVEAICIIWFSFEYGSRLLACPNKKVFLKSPMNMIDLLAILPYYISKMLTQVLSSQNSKPLVSVRKVVQVFRILRVLRILKLARHSTGLQALGYTLQKSYKELGMLVMFIALCVLLFSSLIYFAERDVNSKQFSSIPATFWWAVITMTTVGYGDMTPISMLGKFIGSFCCICGVLVIALPIPIIVNNFADYYKDQLRREKALKRKEDMAKARQIGSILSSAQDYDDDIDDDMSDMGGGEGDEDDDDMMRKDNRDDRNRRKEIRNYRSNNEDELTEEENLEMIMLKSKKERSNSLRPLCPNRESKPEDEGDPIKSNKILQNPLVPITYSETELTPRFYRDATRIHGYPSLSPSHDSIFTENSHRFPHSSQTQNLTSTHSFSHSNKRYSHNTNQRNQGNNREMVSSHNNDLANIDLSLITIPDNNHNNEAAMEIGEKMTFSSRMPSKNKTKSMPLVNTQAYRNLQNEIQRKIDRKRRNQNKRNNNANLFNTQKRESIGEIPIKKSSKIGTERETLLIQTADESAQNKMADSSGSTSNRRYGGKRTNELTLRLSDDIAQQLEDHRNNTGSSTNNNQGNGNDEDDNKDNSSSNNRSFLTRLINTLLPSSTSLPPPKTSMNE